MFWYVPRFLLQHHPVFLALQRWLFQCFSLRQSGAELEQHPDHAPEARGPQVWQQVRAAVAGRLPVLAARWKPQIFFFCRNPFFGIFWLVANPMDFFELSNNLCHKIHDPRIDNINDASKKCNDLRARLFKMDWYADKFDALPSGVWNKIDAQSWGSRWNACLADFCPQQALSLMLADITRPGSDLFRVADVSWLNLNSLRQVQEHAEAMSRQARSELLLEVRFSCVSIIHRPCTSLNCTVVKKAAVTLAAIYFGCFQVPSLFPSVSESSRNWWRANPILVHWLWIRINTCCTCLTWSTGSFAQLLATGTFLKFLVGGSTFMAFFFQKHSWLFFSKLFFSPFLTVGMNIKLKLFQRWPLRTSWFWARWEAFEAGRWSHGTWWLMVTLIVYFSFITINTIRYYIVLLLILLYKYNVLVLQ